MVAPRPLARMAFSFSCWTRARFSAASVVGCGGSGCGATEGAPIGFPLSHNIAVRPEDVIGPQPSILHKIHPVATPFRQLALPLKIHPFQPAVRVVVVCRGPRLNPLDAPFVKKTDDLGPRPTRDLRHTQGLFLGTPCPCREQPW